MFALESFFDLLLPLPYRPRPRHEPVKGPCCPGVEPRDQRRCATCRSSMCGRCCGFFNGMAICGACGEEIAQDMQREKAGAAEIPFALAGGATAGALCGFRIYWAAVHTGFYFDLTFFLYGYFTGLGALFFSGFKRGPSVQVAAGLSAAVGVLAVQVLVALHFHTEALRLTDPVATESVSLLDPGLLSACFGRSGATIQLILLTLAPAILAFVVPLRRPGALRRATAS